MVTKTCNIHGEYQSKERYDEKLERYFYSHCPTCRQITEEKEQLEKEREKRQKVLQLTKDSGIPRRYLQSSLDNYLPVNKDAQNNKKLIKAYIMKQSELLKSGTSMVLCGTPGTGKTHLACAIGTALLQGVIAVKYISIYNLLLSIKETYNKKYIDSKTEKDLIDRYINYELLILDEVGVQFGSEYEKIIFFQILNGRYEEMKPTILITNLNQEGLTDCIGERCVDRIKENGGAVIPFTWDSYRTNKQIGE